MAPNLRTRSRRCCCRTTTSGATGHVRQVQPHAPLADRLHHAQPTHGPAGGGLRHYPVLPHPLRTRQKVVELLEDYGFEIEPSHFANDAEALTGTRVLTPEDLDGSTRADAFLNGKYYECPVTCADLDKIDACGASGSTSSATSCRAARRHARPGSEGREHRAQKDSTNVLQMEVVRPWGRKGEDVFSTP